VRELLKQSFDARVLAVFDHACDLVTPNGEVIALVTPDIGDGPLNIVVESKSEDFASLAVGTAARINTPHFCHPERSEESLSRQVKTLRFAQVDRELELQVTLNTAAIWEPCPDWDALRNQRAAIANRRSSLQAIALHHAPTESLLPVVPGRAQAEQEGISPCVREAAQALQAGWNGDAVQLHTGATRLAGLGNGLTPAGDDFLIGVMLWAWVAHPTPEAFCGATLQAAAPRTTTLSAAFLCSAAKGECSAAWHQLLATLTHSDNDLATAVQQVLAHGATSGADTLAGFLYATYFSGDLSNERLQPGAQK